LLKGGELSGRTPEEIRTLLRQAGMTEEEAMRLARERNIELPGVTGPPGGGLFRQGGAVDSARLPVSLPSARRPVTAVPGFANRPAAANLAPYGFDIFQYAPTTFEPAGNSPTPTSYRVGPGDELIVTVWGQTELNYTLTITRDGYVVIPDAGKVQVAGQSIDQVRQRLLDRMTVVYEGLRHGKSNATTFLEVSLGKIRSVQVFVLGNAQVPGGYSLSGLSTAFTAVYYAGGPNVEGSLRTIRVARSDGTVDTVDFYEYILYGKKASDVRVRDGDAVFIPTAGPRVAITGAVSRPAIYELRPGETLANLLEMSGGLRYSAYDRQVHIERVIPFAKRSGYRKDVLDIDLNFGDAEELRRSSYALEDGDIVVVNSIGFERENLIWITGNVRKPGPFELTAGMRVADLVRKADGLFENTFTGHATIVRTLPDLRKELASFDLGRALEGDPLQNIELHRLDSVVVYDNEFFHPVHSVSIDGAVRTPGSYMRTEGMTVRDLIVMAGGVTDRSDVSSIEVSRVDSTTHLDIAKTFRVSLPEAYWRPTEDGDFVLADFDHVSVRFKPEFNLLKKVTVVGEAEYPGTYAIQFEGEKLSSLLGRIGGFKPTAYVEGVRFLRKLGTSGISKPSPEIMETQQLDTLSSKYGIPIKPRLASNEVPINIEEILDDTTSLDNLMLQDGDSLIVPRDPGVVYVEGQVYVPSSVPYRKGASLSYYLQQAGGAKRDADEDNVVVVLPNNRKWDSGGFLSPADEILSGSTIIAPLKIEEPSNTLEVLREWVTIAASTTTLGFIVWQVTK
jgi:protein involved in polysaccharide export with SLBB domain